MVAPVTRSKECILAIQLHRALLLPSTLSTERAHKRASCLGKGKPRDDLDLGRSLIFRHQFQALESSGLIRLRLRNRHHLTLVLHDQTLDMEIRLCLR